MTLLAPREAPLTLPDGSITHWIRLVQDGHSDAAGPLWERYFTQLEALARTRLGTALGPSADAEDVALSAFDSLCRGLKQGRFPRLRDRDELWRLLVVVTARKAMHVMRREQAQKRGGEMGAISLADDAGLLEQIIGREPTPDFAIQVAEEYTRLLGSLPSPELQQLAVWKMEGYTNSEIAQKWDCTKRTVDRRLRLIRRQWEHECQR